MEGDGKYERKLVGVLEAKGVVVQTIDFNSRFSRFSITLTKENGKNMIFVVPAKYPLTYFESIEYCCRKILKFIREFPVAAAERFDFPIFPILTLDEQFEIVKSCSEAEWKKFDPELDNLVRSSSKSIPRAVKRPHSEIAVVTKTMAELTLEDPPAVKETLSCALAEVETLSCVLAEVEKEKTNVEKLEEYLKALPGWNPEFPIICLRKKYSRGGYNFYMFSCPVFGIRDSYQGTTEEEAREKFAKSVLSSAQRTQLLFTEHPSKRINKHGVIEDK